jgi:hypothetical protein
MLCRDSLFSCVTQETGLLTNQDEVNNSGDECLTKQGFWSFIEDQATADRVRSIFWLKNDGAQQKGKRAPADG